MHCIKVGQYDRTKQIGLFSPPVRSSIDFMFALLQRCQLCPEELQTAQYLLFAAWQGLHRKACLASKGKQKLCAQTACQEKLCEQSACTASDFCCEA